MSGSSVTTDSSNELEQIWFTRCPVPTATGIAYKLGWLGEAFAREGIKLSTLQESSSELARHHYDHQLDTLIREGGNMLSIAARAQGANTKLIGLTWIDEWQTILVRPESGISEPAHLLGKRLALPAWVEHDIPSHVRGCSIARGMSLHGYKGALKEGGLSFDDVTFVEVPAGGGRRRHADTGTGRGPGGLWSGLEFLRDGRVDAVYVKGAAAVEQAERTGAVVGIDLDRFATRRSRVNNGTPRPITVHQNLLDHHFDHVVRFLVETLRAADWAADNLAFVREILQTETWAGPGGVERAYRDDFHKTLHPTLDDERLELFRAQKNFLLSHGFLDADLDFEGWVDRRPLEAAVRQLRLESRAKPAAVAPQPAV